MDQHMQFLESRCLLSLGAPTADVVTEPALAVVAKMRVAATPVGTYVGTSTSLTYPGGWDKGKMVIKSWNRSTGALRGTLTITHMTNPGKGQVERLSFSGTLDGTTRSFKFTVGKGTVTGTFAPKYLSVSGKTKSPDARNTFRLTRQ
jgi:hypothetical protein